MNITPELIEKIESGEYVVIPTKPPEPLLFSMAMRYDHSFGISVDMDDEKIQEMRNSCPIVGSGYYTKVERESMLCTMRQLHEEVVGTGFFKYE